MIILLLSCITKIDFNIKGRREEISQAINQCKDQDKILFLEKVTYCEAHEENSQGLIPIEEAIKIEKIEAISALLDNVCFNDVERVVNATLELNSSTLYGLLKRNKQELLSFCLKIANEASNKEALEKILEVMEATKLEKEIVFGTKANIKLKGELKEGNESIIAVSGQNIFEDITKEKINGRVFLECIKLKYKDKALKLIDKEVNIKEKTKTDWTALMYAAEHGDVDLVNAIIAKVKEDKKYINAQDQRGWTALMSSCFNNNDEISKVLISAGADFDAENRYGIKASMLDLDKETSSLCDYQFKVPQIVADFLNLRHCYLDVVDPIEKQIESLVRYDLNQTKQDYKGFIASLFEQIREKFYDDEKTIKLQRFVSLVIKCIKAVSKSYEHQINDFITKLDKLSQLSLLCLLVRDKRFFNLAKDYLAIAGKQQHNFGLTEYKIENSGDIQIRIYPSLVILANSTWATKEELIEFLDKLQFYLKKDVYNFLMIYKGNEDGYRLSHYCCSLGNVNFFQIILNEILKGQRNEKELNEYLFLSSADLKQLTPFHLMCLSESKNFATTIFSLTIESIYQEMNGKVLGEILDSQHLSEILVFAVYFVDNFDIAEEIYLLILSKHGAIHKSVYKRNICEQLAIAVNSGTTEFIFNSLDFIFNLAQAAATAVPLFGGPIVSVLSKIKFENVLKVTKDVLLSHYRSGRRKQSIDQSLRKFRTEYSTKQNAKGIKDLTFLAKSYATLVNIKEINFKVSFDCLGNIKYKTLKGRDFIEKRGLYNFLNEDVYKVGIQGIAKLGIFWNGAKVNQDVILSKLNTINKKLEILNDILQSFESKKSKITEQETANYFFNIEVFKSSLNDLNEILQGGK